MIEGQAVKWVGSRYVEDESSGAVVEPGDVGILAARDLDPDGAVVGYIVDFPAVGGFTCGTDEIVSAQ